MPGLLGSEVERRYRLLGGNTPYRHIPLPRGERWTPKHILETSLAGGDGPFAVYAREHALMAVPDTSASRLIDYSLVRDESSEPEFFDPMREADLLTNFTRFGRQLKGRGLWTEWRYDEEISKEAASLHETYGSLRTKGSLLDLEPEADSPVNLAWFGLECLSLAVALDVHNAMQVSEHPIRKRALKSLLDFEREQHPGPLGGILAYFNSGDLKDDQQYRAHTGPWLAAKISVALLEFTPILSLRFESSGRSDFRRGVSIPTLGAAVWLTLYALVLDGTATQKCAYVNCPYDFVRKRKNQEYCHPEHEGRYCKRNHDRWVDRRKERIQ